jgi:hypothetical protein
MSPPVPMLHREVKALVFDRADYLSPDDAATRSNVGPGTSSRSVGVTISGDDGFIRTVDGRAFTPFRQIHVRDNRDTCELLLCENVTDEEPAPPIAQIQFSLGDSTHIVTCTTPLMIVRFGAGMILPLEGLGMFSRDRDLPLGATHPAAPAKADVNSRRSKSSSLVSRAGDGVRSPMDIGRSRKRRRISATASSRKRERSLTEYDAVDSTNGSVYVDNQSALGGCDMDAVDIDEFQYDTSENDDTGHDSEDEFGGNDEGEDDEDDDEFVDDVGGCEDVEIDENDDAYSTMSVSSTTDFF